MVYDPKTNRRKKPDVETRLSDLEILTINIDSRAEERHHEAKIKASSLQSSIESIQNNLKIILEKTEDLKDVVKLQNGSINNLKIWRSYIVGGLTVIIFFLPMIYKEFSRANDKTISKHIGYREDYIKHISNNDIHK